MNSKFYYKYIDFLKSHSLYDEDFLDFFWNNAIFIKLKDNDYSYLVGNVIIVTNEQKRIEFIIPSVPYLKSDKDVAVAIYAYVQTLTKITRIGRKENYDVYFNYVLPMFYEKIYIEENINKRLLSYQIRMQKKLLKDNYNFYVSIINRVNGLYRKYNTTILNDKLIANKAKKLAKDSAVY